MTETIIIREEPTIVQVDEESVRVVVERVAGPQGPIGPQGPQGLPGAAGGAHTHIQGSASASWTINHNFGYAPDVHVYTPGSVEMEAEVIHLNLNQTMVSFASPQSGYARLV